MGRFYISPVDIAILCEVSQFPHLSLREQLCVFCIDVEKDIVFPEYGYGTAVHYSCIVLIQVGEM